MKALSKIDKPACYCGRPNLQPYQHDLRSQHMTCQVTVSVPTVLHKLRMLLYC